MLRYTLFIFILACSGGSACGSRSTNAPEPTVTSPEPATPAPAAATPVQAVHEWGLVSVRSGSFELAAGPGRQAPAPSTELTIDKPVLYVHANAATSLHVEVAAGEGMSVAEHYPPAQAPLTWDVEVAPGECTTPRDYTGACNSTDGYCETNELALYETSDAACLTQAGEGGISLPLLFYRLRADDPPAMPLSVDRRGAGEVSLFNTGLEPGASIWRVTWDGTQVHATRSLAPAAGEELVIQGATGDVAAVRAAIREDLAGLGLTGHEGEAFMRAWDSALFGAQGSIDAASVDEDGDPVDGIPVDMPVDSLTADETMLDRRGAGSPRVTDALLYWLPASNIESMAALTFRPVPQKVSRAILVRVDLN